MATEVFANNASTTLSANYTAASGTLSVTSASAFPTTGNFRILIGTNILLVTAVSGTTFTVVGGQEGTTDASATSGATVTHVITKGSLFALWSTRPRFTNSSSAVYTIDSTGNNPDCLIFHNKSGNVSYLLPSPSDGREFELEDFTGAVQTAANWVSIVPHASESINGSTGFAMSGTAFHFTNGSATVTATSSFFTRELYVGCSIQSSNQAGVNYIVSAIGSDTSLTLKTNFSGTTTTTATATRTSLLFAANFGRLFIRSDGTNWTIRGDGTPTVISFTTSPATFIPPAGTTTGMMLGCGGGGGGGTGATATTAARSGGGGGGGAPLGIVNPTWTGNTGYAVTIGTGGAGATGGVLTNGNNGNPGGNSSVGALASFVAASGGAGASSSTGTNAAGGVATTDANGSNVYTTGTNNIRNSIWGPSPQSGASGWIGSIGGVSNNGVDGPTSFGGTGGASGSSNLAGGGGGGGAGAFGAGAIGSAGVDGSGGSANGSNAAANTGGGGGGSGATSTGSAVGNGGNGGSGFVSISYVL